jgi:hypothetical protein
LIHQNRTKALAGAIVISGIGSCLHAALPTFEADKAMLSVLLATDLLEDLDGRLASHAAAPPVLPPFDMQGVRSCVGNAMLWILPIKEVSEEEMQRLKEVRPPMVITAQRCDSFHLMALLPEQ